MDTNPYTIGGKTLLGANERLEVEGSAVVGGGGVVGGAVPSKMAS